MVRDERTQQPKAETVFGVYHRCDRRRTQGIDALRLSAASRRRPYQRAQDDYSQQSFHVQSRWRCMMHDDSARLLVMPGTSLAYFGRDGRRTMAFARTDNSPSWLVAVCVVSA